MPSALLLSVLLGEPGCGGEEPGSRDPAGSVSDGSTLGDGAAADPGECRATLRGATGDEPGGIIPVCCTPSDEERAQIDEAFALLNEYRAARGLPALVYDRALEETIQGHCRHMAEHTFWGHDAPERSVASAWTRADLCGASANAENLANGVDTAAEVMALWKASHGHDANMLSENATKVGIGHFAGYWGQIFGR